MELLLMCKLDALFVCVVLVAEMDVYIIHGSKFIATFDKTAPWLK